MNKKQSQFIFGDAEKNERLEKNKAFPFVAKVCSEDYTLKKGVAVADS